MFDLHLILSIVMGWIRGAIVSCCIPFLIFYWSDGAFAVPSSSHLPISGKRNPLYSSFEPIHVNPIRSNPKSEDCSGSKRQQLLNQASILLKKLSPESNNPPECASQDPETTLIKNLIDRLEALEEINTQVANPSRTRPSVIISEVTYNSIVNRYNNIGILANNCQAQKDASIVLSALYKVFVIFNEIITEQLPNVQLPNLCNKLLALDNQLEATCAPQELRAAVADFIQSLTLALTGQNQVTITTICSCLNDLENSIVTVVQNDKSVKLRALLENLVNAVINAVVSTNNSYDIVKIVKNYVASINEAIKQDAESRAGGIYNSVLNFEKGLSQVLIKPGLTVNKESSDLLTIPCHGDTSKKPKDPSFKIEPSYDASDIVTDGSVFIVNYNIVQLEDDDQNVVGSMISGTWKLVDPVTNVSFSGSFAAQQGTIDLNTDGSITIVGTTLYDVDLPDVIPSCSPTPRVKRQGVLTLQDSSNLMTDKQGNSKRTESGTYSITDSITGRCKTGEFVVKNTISKLNSNGSINVIKAGVTTVDGPQTASLTIKKEDGDAYFLYDECIFNTLDKNGNLGVGLYDMEIPPSLKSESGSYTIQKKSVIKNDDGSVSIKTSGSLRYDDPGRAHFVLDIKQNSVKDKYGHVTAIASGQLTRTDSKTGQKTLRNCVIPNIIEINNSDGTKNIIQFGKFINTFKTNPTTKTKGSPGVTGLGKPVLVSKNAFQALLHDLRPVKPKTDPKQTTPGLQCAGPGLTSGDGSNKVSINAKYNATTIVSDNTVFIINEFITPLLDSEGNIFSQIELGTYWFRDVKTNLSWYGAFETTSFSEETDSPNKMITTKVGTFEVAPPSLLCAPSTYPVDGLFTLKNYAVSGKNGASPKTESGTYSLTDATTNDARSGSFVVLNSIAKSLDSGMIEVVKTGFLDVDDPGTTPPSEEISVKGTGRYFLFKDRDSLNPEIDGNKGTGIYSIKDSTTNGDVSGTYIIQQRTIIENSDQTVDIKTVGVIYVDGSDANSASGSSASILNVANGAEFTLTDHLVTVTDNYGHTSTYGTGKFIQTDPETGAIESATYEIKNFVTITGDDGATSNVKFGRIPDDAYTTKGKSSTPSEPIAAANDVFFRFKDHLFGSPNPDGEYGTGEYKIHNIFTKEISEGTYDIRAQSAINKPDGTVNRKTSGVIYIDSSLSSPKISDLRLTILNGADFTLNEILTYSKDANDNVLVRGTGLFTQTASTTGIVLTTNYTINSFKTELGSDESQDVIRSGTIDYQSIVGSTVDPSKGTPISGSVSKPLHLKLAQKPPQVASSRDNTVAFSFNDFLRDIPDNDGNYGRGTYEIKKPSTNELVIGVRVMQDQSSFSDSNGVLILKSSGVISVYKDKSSPINSLSDTRLVILDGARYTLEEIVNYSGDSIISGIGKLTQTDPKSGTGMLTYYTITTFDASYGTNSPPIINRSGTIDRTEPTPVRVISHNPPKTPTTHPGPKTPTNKPVTDKKYNVHYLFKDHIFGVPHGNGKYGTGEFTIEYPLRKECVEGTYNIWKWSTATFPNGIVNRKSSGIIHVDKSRSSSRRTDKRLAILDGAHYTLEETVTYSKDAHGNVIVSGTGLFTQRVPRSGLTISTNYSIHKFNTECSTDGSQDIVRSGPMEYQSTIEVITNTIDPLADIPNSDSVKTPSNTKPAKKLSQITSGKDDDVYFSFNDFILDVPNNDGNYGIGEYEIQKPATNELVTGTRVIQKQSIITNSDGSVTWKTIGVHSVDKAKSSPTNSLSDSKLVILDGVQYTLEETLSYSTDENANVIVTGTGLLTQKDLKLATIISTYFTINAFDVYYDNGGLKAVVRSGIIDKTTTLAYLTADKPHPATSIVSGTGVGTNYVVFPWQDVISVVNTDNLQPGDVVIIKAKNEHAFVAQIENYESPVTFYVANVSGVVQAYESSRRVFAVSENAFSIRNCKLIDAVLEDLPCET